MTERSIGYRFKKINDLMIADANKNLKSLGLTFSQQHVLIYLEHQANKEASLKETEHFFQTAQSTMAGIAARLEDKGLVESVTDENDRRIKKIRLTVKGEDVLENTKEHMKEGDRIMLAGISQDDQEFFNKILNQIYENLKQAEQGTEQEVIC